jgi:hypothetical protein
MFFIKHRIADFGGECNMSKAAIKIKILPEAAKKWGQDERGR